MDQGRADRAGALRRAGPGRGGGGGGGTLARDALRAMKRYGLEPKVHFVESSVGTQAASSSTPCPMRSGITTSRRSRPKGPILLVANEFLDALPVRQLVKTAGRLARADGGDRGQRRVGLRAASPATSRWTRPCPKGGEAPEGTLIETSPAAASRDLRSCRAAGDAGAERPCSWTTATMLLRTGSTLQAVREHRKVDAFAHPGEADLTAHVDFATLAPIAQSRGARWLGTVPQVRWLRALGIETRADALSQFAPHHREALMAKGG